MSRSELKLYEVSENSQILVLIEDPPTIKIKELYVQQLQGPFENLNHLKYIIDSSFEKIYEAYENTMRQQHTLR